MKIVPVRLNQEELELVLREASKRKIPLSTLIRSYALAMIPDYNHEVEINKALHEKNFHQRLVELLEETVKDTGIDYELEKRGNIVVIKFHARR